MKKILMLCVAVMMAATSMKAQHEIGAVVGGMNGVSYKYWFNDALALQADLAVGLTEAAEKVSYGLYDFTINPNVEYHWDLVDALKIYAGGGINFGLCSALKNTSSDYVNGKFGINAIAGLQYDFNSVPLALAFDFRPGYGMSFRSDASHFFDWKLAFAVRYKL